MVYDFLESHYSTNRSNLPFGANRKRNEFELAAALIQ